MPVLTNGDSGPLIGPSTVSVGRPSWRRTARLHGIEKLTSEGFSIRWCCKVGFCRLICVVISVRPLPAMQGREDDGTERSVVVTIWRTAGKIAVVWKDYDAIPTQVNSLDSRLHPRPTTSTAVDVR